MTKTDDLDHLEDEERQRSSLRWAKADLKVIVGVSSTGDNQKEEEEEEGSKVFWCHSQVLATQSGYVDTLLSTPLPTNNDSNPSKDHKEIVFSDITPSQWERMMRFLTDPSSISKTVEDAMELAPIYDKYDFPMGIKVCDEVLYKKVFQKEMVHEACATELSDEEIVVLVGYEEKPPDSREIDQFVDVIVLSHITNLRKTFYWGREWLHYVVEETFHLESFPLTRMHIQQLLPAIIRDTELPDLFYKILGDELGLNEDDDEWSSISEITEKDTFTKYLDKGGEEFSRDIKEHLLGRYNCRSHDLKNPMFADLFLSLLENHYASYAAIGNTSEIKGHIHRIKVVFPSGDHELAGKYEGLGGDCYFLRKSGHACKVYRCSTSGQWKLDRGFQTQFVCQYGQFSHVPPKTGWVVHSENNMESDVVPTIEY